MNQMEIEANFADASASDCERIAASYEKTARRIWALDEESRERKRILNGRVHIHRRRAEEWRREAKEWRRLGSGEEIHRADAEPAKKVG